MVHYTNGNAKLMTGICGLKFFNRMKNANKMVGYF
jgi:hypothetical protein